MHASPLLYDIDKDGVREIALATYNGEVLFFRYFFLLVLCGCLMLLVLGSVGLGAQANRLSMFSILGFQDT